MRGVSNGFLFFFRWVFRLESKIRKKLRLNAFFIEYPCCPVEDAVQVGQCHPVVGDRDTCFDKGAESVLQLLAGNHTATALNHECKLAGGQQAAR